jgi:hypothetical protein
MVSMLLQSTAGVARPSVEDRHRMRNRLLVVANGLQETARIRCAARPRWIGFREILSEDMMLSAYVGRAANFDILLRVGIVLRPQS